MSSGISASKLLRTAPQAIHRRTVLRGALLGAATIAVSAVMPSAAMAAFGSDVAAIGVHKGMRRVQAPDGSAVLMPAVLGARLTVRPGLPAGTTLTLGYDARVYRSRADAVLTRGTRTFKPVALQSGMDAATSQATLTLVLEEALPAGSYDLVAGSMNPVRYPGDLLALPVPLTFKAADAAGTSLADATLSRPDRAGGLPWGVELGAAWQESRWDAEYLTWVPALVTLFSTGPGDLPPGARLRVLLDEAVFESLILTGVIGPDGASFPGKIDSGTVPGFLLATVTLGGAVPAGSRVTLGVDAVTRPLSGALAVLQPPVIEAVTKSDGLQRFTGAESLTRHDSIFSPETLLAAVR